MLFSVLTIFPDLLDSPLKEGIIRRARNEDKIRIEVTNIRDFAEDKHAMTDDRPFGGGEGMVMKPEPLARAVKHVRKAPETEKRVVLLSPQGRLFNQKIAEEFVEDQQLILVCGRYEGVDERLISSAVDEEWSLGDFVLSGGEIAAMAVIDAVTRLLPGVLGDEASAIQDSFMEGLLDHPHYTRPEELDGRRVPSN